MQRSLKFASSWLAINSIIRRGNIDRITAGWDTVDSLCDGYRPTRVRLFEERHNTSHIRNLKRQRRKFFQKGCNLSSESIRAGQGKPGEGMAGGLRYGESGRLLRKDNTANNLKQTAKHALTKGKKKKAQPRPNLSILVPVKIPVPAAGAEYFGRHGGPCLPWMFLLVLLHTQ